jgi:heparan-alpha-glucosaminide N-acetyltransferase
MDMAKVSVVVINRTKAEGEGDVDDMKFVALYTQKGSCHGCALERLALLRVPASGRSPHTYYFDVPCAFPTYFAVDGAREMADLPRFRHRSHFASVEHTTLGQGSAYCAAMEVGPASPRTVSLSLSRVHLSPATTHFATPIYTWLLILVAAAILSRVLSTLWARLRARREGERERGVEGGMDGDGSSSSVNTSLLASGAAARADEAAAAAAASTPLSSLHSPTPASRRLVSLDVVRGSALSIMIFVNYNGGYYERWFNHSVWSGNTFADVVFPVFIWIMGVSLSLSSAARGVARPGGKGRVMRGVAVRSIKMALLGIFIINNAYDWGVVRWPGVLQRFAIAYATVSSIAILIPKLGAPVPGDEAPLHHVVLADVRRHLLEWLVAALLLGTWFIVTFHLPVPGCPTGYLGPGGPLVGEPLGSLVHCTGGAAGYIDRLVFGEAHLYATPTCGKTYRTGPYDPEGLLGNLTSIFICFLGLQAGRVIHTSRRHGRRVVRWFIAGCTCLLLAGALCSFDAGAGPVPIVKNLWTPSYILLNAGIGHLALVLAYVAIDWLGFWGGGPFRYMGSSSIVIYVGSEVLQPYSPFSFATARSHGVQLSTNVVGVLCWQLIGYLLYSKGIIISL